MYNVVAMKDFVGNKATISYLEQAIANDNVSHAYLFCGPEGVGKTKAGLHFAKLLLCESEKPLDCKGCPSCKLFESGSHPDFHHLDKEAVLVDEVRELISSLELRPYRGKGKVALVSHTERLTNQALNSFLKTLEEPTSQTTIILTTENKNNLLPTIVSRARQVNFGLSADRQIFEHLNIEMSVKKEEAARITSLASGRIGVAIALSENDGVASEIATLVGDFNRIYKSQDIYEKISFADKMAKDKDNLISNLHYLELATRSELMRQTKESGDRVRMTELLTLMDKISRSREMVNKNANTRLVIEGLLLGSMS